MTAEKKPKKKWRRIVGLIFSIVSIVVLTYVSIALIMGRPITFSWFTRIFVPPAPIELADTLQFDSGRQRVFADLGDAVASAGTLGIQVLEHDGSEALRDQFRMYRPAINSAGSRAISFDIGGNAVRVFDSRQVFSEIETEDVIISASINRNGWFSINTQDDSGGGGTVIAYNNDGIALFEVSLGSGYAFSSLISPDNRNLAVLNLSGVGSRITLYQGMNRSDYDHEFILPGELIVHMHFLSNGDLLAVTQHSIIAIGRNGVSREFFEFSDRRLGRFIMDDNVVILHLLDYGVGHSGSLLRLDERGNVRSEISIQREILSMSHRDGFLAVLYNDGVAFYNNSFNEISVSDDHSLAGISRIIALENGLALGTGEHATVAVREAVGE